MLSFQTIARRALPLAFAASLVMPGLVPPDQALAEEPVVRDHRDSTTHVQLVIKRMLVHDDLDWGDGDVSTTVRVVSQPDDCPACAADLIMTTIPEFSATDGQAVQINRIVPSAGDSIMDASVAPSVGIPIKTGFRYTLAVFAREVDPAEDDIMGALFEDIVNDDGEIRFGTFTARAWGACNQVPLYPQFCRPDVPGAYSVEYEIRRTPLPDLQPTAFRVAEDRPGDRDDLICFTVKNRGPVASAPFLVRTAIDGTEGSTRDTPAAGLAAGESREQCTGQLLPSSGTHRATVQTDPSDTMVEMDERNNELVVGLDRTSAGQVRAPVGAGNATTDASDSAPAGDGPIIVIRAATPTPPPVFTRPTQADLTVSAVKVNGEAPDGKSDCKDGKNAVAAVVKNSGPADAEGFVVRLTVDGSQVGEQTMDRLLAGQEREVTFEGVSLKTGTRKLAVAVNANGTVSESNEENNGRTVTAACQSAA
jgi:hypothetical protein